MSDAFLVGHITVKNPEKWDEYRRQVPATLTPWGAELVFRGKQVDVLAGENLHADIVVIRFPDIAAINRWHSSPAYQALFTLGNRQRTWFCFPMKRSFNKGPWSSFRQSNTLGHLQ